MAEEVATINGVIKQSIARVELFTDAALPPNEWRIVYHFEDGAYVNGALQGATTFGTRRVERRFGDIKNSEIAGGMTGAQIAALIQAGGYLFRQQDIDAAQAAQQGAGNAG
jgi:hypothetical protein